MKYNDHNKQAYTNDKKTAAQFQPGDFIHTATAGGKDVSFIDFVDAHEFWNMGGNCRLCQIVDIIDVAEDYDLFTNWLERDAPDHRGGSASDDVPEDKLPEQMTREDYATFYDLITVYRKPSGQWIGVDCQGYEYWRYVHMPKNYGTLFAVEVENARQTIKAREAAKAAEERARLEAHAQAYAARIEEIRREYSGILKENPENGRQVAANIRRFFKHRLPDLTFKVSATQGYWRGEYDVNVTAPKDTPEEVRQQIKTLCDLWNESMPTGEMTDRHDGYGEYEARGHVFNMYGFVKYALRVDYWLDEPFTPMEQPTPKADGLTLVDYSEKAIALIGDTKSIKEQLKAIGGRFNARLSCGAGWIFSKKKENELKALLAF